MSTKDIYLLFGSLESYTTAYASLIANNIKAQQVNLDLPLPVNESVSDAEIFALIVTLIDDPALPFKDQLYMIPDPNYALISDITGLNLVLGQNNQEATNLT